MTVQDRTRLIFKYANGLYIRQVSCAMCSTLLWANILTGALLKPLHSATCVSDARSCASMDSDSDRPPLALLQRKVEISSNGVQHVAKPSSEDTPVKPIALSAAVACQNGSESVVKNMHMNFTGSTRHCPSKSYNGCVIDADCNCPSSMVERVGSCSTCGCPFGGCDNAPEYRLCPSNPAWCTYDPACACPCGALKLQYSAIGGFCYQCAVLK